MRLTSCSHWCCCYHSGSVCFGVDAGVVVGALTAAVDGASAGAEAAVVAVDKLV